MKTWIVAAGMLIVAVGGCSEKNTLIAKAHIIQRKALENGKIRVNYEFNTSEHTLIKDSTEIDKEKVVPHDSVNVRFSPANPSRNTLQLP